MAENVYDGYQAGHVNVDRSALRSLAAQTASVERTAIQRLATETMTAQNSAMGVVHTSTLEMHASAAGLVVGDYVRVEDSSVAVLLAPRVNGNVKAVITIPAAFAFGFGYFFARRLAGWIFGRPRS